MGVPLLDLKAQYATQKDEINRAVLEVLESQHFILGPQVKELEEAIGRYVGATFACGVSSGTDALLIALMAEGVGPGDEVITPPYSFFATAGCPVRLGATPVFAEIEPRSFNLDPAQLEAAITPRTKAVVPVDIAGHPAPLDEILAIARAHGLKVVEDAAHATETWHKDRKVGSIADATAFSFYATKNLSTGEGGMLTCADEELAAKARIIGLHGMSKDAWKRYDKGGSWFYEATQTRVD